MALRRLASVSLFPLLVAAITTVAVVGSTLDLAGPLGLPASANQGVVTFAVIACFYALVAVLERLHPYRFEWNRAAGDVRTDVLHLLVTGPGSNALFEAMFRGVALSAAMWLSARHGVHLWPDAWSPVAQLFLALLVAELGHYWFHRLSHENPWVWRLHATHHSAPRLYWLNATRFHPLDLFCLITSQTVPLVLLGPPPRTFLMYTLFAVVYGQLQHCNIDVRTGAIDWLFSTPGLHRWHHSTDPREGNANYGAILITWDIIFGTLFRPVDRAFDGRVGIGMLPNFPSGYLAQLASPFRWARIRAAKCPAGTQAG
jgi:sterol desaturase/sphingolipid hydroxylase (fatty acid hydroxylase superfamily)